MSERGLKNLRTRKAILTISMVMAFFCISLFFATNVLAQTTNVVTEGIEAVEQPLGLPATDIRLIVANIIRAALGLIGIVLIIIIMYGGFLWMTAGGNEEQIGKAKKVLVNAVIGLAIMLSAYGIVAFVMRMLGVGFGTSYGTGTTPSGYSRFAGSGALGGMIKDHYPTRDQKDVPRNTKIIITFNEPILLEKEFVTENTGDNFFGNCKASMQNWETDCDTLKLADNYINIKETKSGKSIKTAAILASTSTVNKKTGVYTLVLRPITSSTNGGYLGDDKEKIQYTVMLGQNIKKDDPANGNKPAFVTDTETNYFWSFISDTKFDKTPPYIKSVYPDDKSTTVKNTVIQIDFNEAMDPTGIQGEFEGSAGKYVVSGNNIFLVTAYSKVPVGRFDLLNGYRTLEFSSTLECGKNACGRSIFCLPVCDTLTANCTTVNEIINGKSVAVKTDIYNMLLKTGSPINTSSFEAIPFSGFMDISGNAMDGNKNGKVDNPDKPTPTLGVFSISKNADNYSWYFTVKDSIDTTAPYITFFRPGIKVGELDLDALWQMVFSKRMRVNSLYKIDITESPTTSLNNIFVPMWHVVGTVDLSNKLTTTTMGHGTFLKDTEYYPIIDSDVEDVNYNCFYPAQGPAINNAGGKESVICDGTNITNCTNAVRSPGTDFFCNGTLQSTAGTNGATAKKCVDDLIKGMGKTP